MATKASYAVLLFLLLLVILNSFYIRSFCGKAHSISAEHESSDSLDSLSKRFEAIEEMYEKNEIFISLSVSHDDLTNIEDLLAEIRGAINTEDKDGALIAKSRFENAILHLGRLSSVNLESIF